MTTESAKTILEEVEALTGRERTLAKYPVLVHVTWQLTSNNRHSPGQQVSLTGRTTARPSQESS